MILETKRLLLRPHRLDDLPAMHVMDTDAGARAFCGGVADLETTRTFLEYSINEFGQGRMWKFAIDLKTGEPLVGWCWLKWCAPLDAFEIGYQIARSFWGRGIAPEAACRVATFAFEEQGIERVHFLIDPANASSRRVAEKLGLSPQEERPWDSRSGYVLIYPATSSSFS